MTGKQQLVGAAGVGLVLLEFWTSDAHSVITGGLFGSSSPTAGHSALKTFALELVFVGGATLIAGVSDGWANAMLALLVGLGLLFAINHPHPFQTAAAKKGATP